MLLTAKTTTTMLAVCARAAFMGSRSRANRSVVLQMSLDQLLRRSFGTFSEMDLDSFDPTREAERKPLAVPGIDGRHLVLAHVEALPSKASRHLLLDATLCHEGPVLE